MNSTRGMHMTILRKMAEGIVFDLRTVSEPMRQRLIDLGMEEPPLVTVDADQVSITCAGKALVNGF